ncbi:MAG: hypothetical protein ACRCWR_00170 [Saezia sp.]
MGFDPISLGLLAVSAIGAGASMQQQKKAQKQQAAAQRQAQKNAEAQMREQDEMNNKANQRRANPYGAMGAGKGGVSGTMLTGPQGVDPNDMKLGKSNLLGM